MGKQPMTRNTRTAGKADESINANISFDGDDILQRTEAEIKKQTNAALMKICQEHGLSRSGLKNTLVSRLVDHIQKEVAKREAAEKKAEGGADNEDEEDEDALLSS